MAPGPPVSTAAVGNSAGRASVGRRRGLGPAPLDLDADALDEGALPRHLHRARVVRTKATALSGLTPSRTARMARPVPVLPTPPPHPISTRSPAALSHASVRAATASDPELGTQKSRHRTQRESHGAFAGSRAARYTPNSGSGPSGTPARSPRPRTLRPDGNATTPGAVDSHASLNAVLLFSASRGPRRVEEADRCARILAPLGLVTPSTWTG